MRVCLISKQGSTGCRDKVLCSRCNAHVMQHLEWQQGAQSDMQLTGHAELWGA